MSKIIKDIVFNEKHNTIMANDIVRGKQDMTLQEARILRHLITQIKRDDTDFYTYQMNIQDLANFLGISESNLYRDIKNICENLITRTVKISTDNPKEPWKIFSWVNFASYDGEGTITLTLSEQMRPFLIELNDCYTKYKLENVLHMRSFYAIRLYELLKTEEFKEKTEYVYTLDFLREFFDCSEKYERISAFKSKVIDMAVNEINTKSDIRIDKVDYLKKGRKYDRVKFTIQLGKFYGKRRKGQFDNLT